MRNPGWDRTWRRFKWSDRRLRLARRLHLLRLVDREALLMQRLFKDLWEIR